MNGAETKLGDLLDAGWKASLEACPELATRVGVAGHDHNYRAQVRSRA